METNYNGAYIQCSSPFKLKYLFLYPFHYLVQLESGSRKEHAATCLLGSIYEEKLAGVIVTAWTNWINNFEYKVSIYLYPLLSPLTDEEAFKMRDFYESVKTSKYSIIEYVFSKLPLLKRIKFKKDKYEFCDKIYIRALQEIGRLPANINAANYDPDTTVDLLSRFNLISGRIKIK